MLKHVNYKGLAFLLLFFLLFQGCGPTTEVIVIDEEARTIAEEEEVDEEVIEDVAEERELRVLKIGESNRIRSMDPLFAFNTATKRIIQLTYEGLVRFDKNDELVPAAARRWEVSDDSLTYTFYLRNDLFFHNDESFPHGRGRQVNSRDIVRIFERMASRDVPEHAAGLFMNTIYGFESFYLEQRDVYLEDDRVITSIDGLKAENDSTVVFRLIERDHSFPKKLASPYAVIYPGEPFRFRDDGLHHHPVGTGPFYYDSSIGDSIFVFLRNDNFNRVDDQGRQLPRVHRIELMNVTNENRLYHHFSRGRLDMIVDPGPENIRNLINENNELKAPFRDEYHLEKRSDYNPVALRYNARNQYGLEQADAASVIRHINEDDLRTRLDHPSLEITWHDTNFSQIDVARVFRRFGDGQPDRMVLAFNQDHMPRELSKIIRQTIDNNLQVDLAQRRVFSRDIFLYMDYRHSFLPGRIPERRPDEILRIKSDRYIIYNREIEDIRTNSLSWWINLNHVRIPDEPVTEPEATSR